ncbi:MAG: alpha/beta fold hydrolase [Chloroflexota bacterium]
MNKNLIILIIVILVLANVVPVFAQSGMATIQLLDRNTVEIHRLVDGNRVQLRITLSTPAETASEVAFFLDGQALPVGTCSLKAGDKSCSSPLVDSLGWYWGVDRIAHPARVLQASLNGQPILGAVEFVIKPRPVVMVHGFLSSWETWKPYLGSGGYLSLVGLDGFAVGDGQSPGVLNTGNPSNPSARTNSIAENAEILKGYLVAVQKQTGAEKVDLLAHSMGGMISRYYLDRLMDNDNVAQVIFLGTPMAGSACVYPLAALGYLMPASLEILPDYMNHIFNPQIVNRHGVPFYMLAGTLLIDPLTSPCASAPSDTVVGLDSATSIALDDVQKLPLYHGNMTADQQVFEKFVLPWLQNTSASFIPRSDVQSPALDVDPGQFSRVFTGHVKPGESAVVKINIDPDVSLANFSLYDSSRSLEIEVRGASGKVINLDAAHNGLMKIEDPATMLTLGYAFKQPKPGLWVVKLMTSASTPAAGADYAILARFIGGTVLNASSSSTILAPGQAVDLSMRLKAASDNLQVMTADALIRKPDGSLLTSPLASQDGGYSVKYLPDQPGLYSVEIRINGNNAQGIGFDRAAFLAFEVQPGTAEVESSRQMLLLAAGGLLLVLIIGLIWLRIRRRWRVSAS